MVCISFAAPTAPSPISPFRRPLHCASRTLLDNRAVLCERVWTATPPRWLQETELLDWLLSLRPLEIHACEEQGLLRFIENNGGFRAGNYPGWLGDVARCADEVDSCFPLIEYPTRSESVLPCKVRPAKQAQIGPVVSAVQDVLQASPRRLQRIVDVGGGHGHLSSALAEAGLPLDVVCLDRNARLLEAGRVLNERRLARGKVQFFLADAVESGTTAGQQDCVVGLHPCGSLGDQICLDASSSRGASAVVLVSCCLQKLQQGEDVRYPLSRAGNESEAIRNGLSFDRRMLGLANRVRGCGGNITGRITRVALRILLERRGLPVPEESRIVHGLSRHRMRRGLSAVAADALRMRGDSRIVSSDEISLCMRAAQVEYDRMRLFSLPRNELGPLLEMAVVLDRASLLAECERFGSVRTVRLFPDSVSMRNLAVLAS